MQTETTAATQIIAQVLGNLPSAGVLLWALQGFLKQHKEDMQMLRGGQAEHAKGLKALEAQLTEMRVESAGKVICHAPIQPWQSK